MNANVVAGSKDECCAYICIAGFHGATSARSKTKVHCYVAHDWSCSGRVFLSPSACFNGGRQCVGDRPAVASLSMGLVLVRPCSDTSLRKNWHVGYLHGSAEERAAVASEGESGERSEGRFFAVGSALTRKG